MPTDSLDLGAVLFRLLRRWPRYVLIAVLSGATMYGITFLMPTWYRARAVLLPPEETDQPLSGLAAFQFLNRMPSIAGSEFHTTGDVYRAILLSRTIMQSIVDRFNLLGEYRLKEEEKAVKELRNHVRVTLGADGLLTIEVEDRQRDQAARMANAFVEELDRFNVERRNSQAKRTRIFLERRVAETDSSSKRAEAALRSYQEQHHVVAPIEAEAASVAPLAELMARQVSLQVQLSVLRSYLREDNERVVQVRTELEGLNQRIAQAPEVQGDLARLIRDVKLYQQSYALLIAQLEEARLRETMDTPTVTVLDEAVPIQKRARPLRGLWALAAAMFATVATAALSEYRGAREDRASSSRVA